MFIYMHALSFQYYAFVCLHSNLCHVIFTCKDAPLDAPFFLAVDWLIDSAILMHVFFDYIFLFHLRLHIRIASCWLTVCLSVVFIFKLNCFYVCSFFHTYTTCTQRLYKGQFKKKLQSYFGFHYKMSLAAQHCSIIPQSNIVQPLDFFIFAADAQKTISLCIFSLK